MATTIHVLTEDATLLSTTETDVNANLASFDPPLPPLPSGDIISGCIQVGLNALTKSYVEPNDATFMPLLSIAGLPYTNDVVSIPSEIETRLTTIATTLGVSDTDLGSLALHAGLLTMNALGPNKGYRPSFV